MNQQLTDALVALAALVIPALVTALIPPLRQYLQARIAAVRHEQLRAWIFDLVLSAEQQFAGAASDEMKLHYVTEQAWLYMQSLGLSLTRMQIRALIEAAVRAMTANGMAVAAGQGSAAEPGAAGND